MAPYVSMQASCPLRDIRRSGPCDWSRGVTGLAASSMSHGLRGESPATLADSSPLTTSSLRLSLAILCPRSAARRPHPANTAWPSLWIGANHERPSVSLSAMTSEAARKVCSCASVASASSAAIARTLAARPRSRRRFPAGVAETSTTTNGCFNIGDWLVPTRWWRPDRTCRGLSPLRSTASGSHG